MATVMFNLFAKNLAGEYKNIIHKERKRALVVEDKRDLSNMKVKNLNRLNNVQHINVECFWSAQMLFTLFWRESIIK